MNIKPDNSKNFFIRFNMYVNSKKTIIISHFLKDPLLKGLLILGSGTAISQILGIIFVPIITRIYPPAIYGTLAVFSSLLSILILGGSLRYELTIPIAENDKDAEYLLILSFLILFILTSILFIILTIWGNYIAGIFHFEFIAPYYWLFCIGFWGSSAYQILTYWALRSKNYIQITHTRIIQSISGSMSKIILGILSLGSLGLICGDIIGRIIGIYTLGRMIFPKMWKEVNKLDIIKLRSLSYKFRKFPSLTMPASIINQITLQIPTLFLSSMYGFEIVGLYALSYSISILPVSYISNAMEQAYSAESAQLFRHKSDEILALYSKTTKRLFMFGAPVILIGAFISPFIFPFIFGSEWKESGIFVLPLSIMVIAHFVVNSTNRLELYGYNQWELAWSICRTALVVFGFYFSFIFKLSAVATILVFSLIMTLMYVICYILNLKAIKLVIQKHEITRKN